MKIILISIACLLLGQYASAQNNILLRAYLKSANSDSLNGVTLQLYLLPDTSLVKVKVYNNGPVSFAVKKFTKYLLRSSSTSFEGTEKTITITDKSLQVTVLLKRKLTSLNNVILVSRKPLVKEEDDKTIVDAEVLANSSTNAFEVLEKTPGAVVDQDGNVYLNSNSPAMVQINGREVKLSAQDLSSLLKSLPAGSINKIEILRNPSAKYDAASSGGIINIVLKKGVKLGSSGSMNTSYFQGVYSTKSVGFSLNRSAGNVNSYLSYQLTDKNSFEELNSQRQIPSDSSILIQKAYTIYPGVNHYMSAGIGVDLNLKLSVGYDLRLSANDSRSTASNLSNILQYNSQGIYGSNESVIKNRGNNLYLGNDFSTKYKIDTTGSEWTTQFDYTYYRSTNAQQYNNYYYQPAKPSLLGDGNTDNTKNIFTAQTDLIWKLKKKFTIETGFKTLISDSKNAAVYFYQTGALPRQQDNYQTNTFHYKESITAAYLQVAKTIIGFTIKPGLRMEITDINGRQLIPQDTSLFLNRTDFFPYLFLRHRLAKMFGFELNGNLIFRRSITRPFYESLNPYPKYVDQYLFDVGNPNLRPQFTTNYEFNIIADTYPVFSIGVNQTKDIFSSVTYQDNITKIAYRTYDNLGSNKEIYLRAVGGIPPGRKYFFYAGAQHNFTEYNGVYDHQPLSYKHGTWTFFSYQQYKAGAGYTFSLNGFMRTGGLQNFYELKNFGGLTLSINKSIMDHKANIILSGNDVLGTNHYSFTLNQGNVHAGGTRVNDTKKIGLTFRYNFGIKPKEEKKQLFDQPADTN